MIHVGGLRRQCLRRLLEQYVGNVAILAIFLGIAATGATIYGVGFGPAAPNELYQISPSTGAATLIGPISGFVTVSAMDAGPDGRLFSNGTLFFGGEDLLLLNSLTGAPTIVAPVTGAFSNASATDFAFGPEGTLFALYAGDSLFTINTRTRWPVLWEHPSRQRLAKQ